MKSKFTNFVFIIALLSILAVSMPVMANPCDDCDYEGGEECDCSCTCCGPGYWEWEYVTDDQTPDNQGSHTPDFDIILWPFGTKIGQWRGMHRSWATSSSCYAHGWGSGNCGSALSGGPWSVSATASAAYNYQKRRKWNGTAPACARAVSLSASGSGSENISATCASHAGNSASAEASGSGMCSSLGNASANMDMHSINCSASYTGGEDKREGNIGIDENDDSTTVTGKYSKIWSTTGTGAATGGASYSVRSSRTYNNDCTSATYTISRSGSVEAGGTGTFTRDGSISFSGSSQVYLTAG